MLVVTDHFTRLAHAFPCRDQSAKQVAKQLWEKYFCIFGFPERIHSDQGASFASQLISELLKVAGVRKSRTTPYHPMGNGSVERFNRTLGNMIRALSPDAKRNWPRHLQSLTFMYNCTVHETTGYPPFYLMYGRVPRLPVDVLFKNILKDPEISSYDHYVVSLAKDLQEAMAIAQEHINKEQNRQAEFYNRRAKGKLIAVGDRVLVSNKRERGKRKTADRWESTIYTVVGVNTSTHTYRIQHPESGQERVVHRNLLMPVNFLPIEVDNVSSRTFVASSETVSSEMVGLVSVVDENTAGSRTQEWIDSLSTVDVHSHSEDSSPEDVLCMSAESGHAGGPHTQMQLNTDDSCTHASLADTQSTHTHATVQLDDTHSARGAPTHKDSSSVRTRVGRIVKPVNRLICQMSQQGIVGDAGQLVGKVSQSIHKIFH